MKELMEIDKIILEQQDICKKYNLEYYYTDVWLKVGISKNINSGEMPINGLRHNPEGDTCGWYIWAGEYDSSDDFFEPMHIIHLYDIYPNIIKYLGLPPQSRFLIDDKGYEDVWTDTIL